jgi:hypothetical protein
MFAFLVRRIVRFVFSHFCHSHFQSGIASMLKSSVRRLYKPKNIKVIASPFWVAPLSCAYFTPLFTAAKLIQNVLLSYLDEPKFSLLRLATPCPIFDPQSHDFVKTTMSPTLAFCSAFCGHFVFC